MSMLSPPNDASWPWAVSIPGLTAAGARFVADTVNGHRPEVQVMQIDPRDFLVLHLDRGTVTALLEALDAATDSPGASGFREVLVEWLEFADGDER